MEKFILQLITENNRVIIPNFGAFIISKEHGISILFNNFLSFNDGLLVNYVAEQKGIDTIVATDQVFDYVDNLKKELDETGTFSIDKLGVFKKDDNGILRFQQADNFGEIFNEDQTKSDDELKDEPKDEPKDEDSNKATLLNIDDEITSTPEEEKLEEKFEENELLTEGQAENLLTLDTESEDNTSTPLKEEPEKETVKPIIKEELKKTEDSKVAESPEEKKPKPGYYAQKAIEEKKRRDIITFVVIAAIILIGLAIYLIFFSNFKDNKKQKTPVKVTEKAVIKTPVKKDTIVVVAKEPVVKKEPVVEPVANTKGLIHIIVGGFKMENNAIKMAEKLKKAGYNNSTIVKKGDMFLVSIDSDFSYRKMEDMQQEVLENEKLESWMYQIK